MSSVARNAGQGAATLPMTRYRRRRCGYVCDPARGEAQRATPPGTPFEDLPDDRRCPDCRAPTSDFDPVAEGAERGDA